MDDTAPPDHEGKLNTKHKSNVVVPYKPNQLYFRPGTFEIVEVPEDEAAAFEAHGRSMCKAVDDLHRANIAVSESVARYSALMNSPDPQALAGAKKDYDKAQSWLKKVQAVLSTNLQGLEPLSKMATGGGSIVELIPLSRTGGTGARGNPGTRQYGRKMVFVDSSRMGSGWRAFPLDRQRPRAGGPRSGPGSQQHEQNGHENLMMRDASGKKKVDTAKLMKQLKDLKPEIKAEIWKTDQFSGVMFDWAEAMNKNLKIERQGIAGHFTNNVDLSAQAQLMRYMGGAGAEAVWDPKAGKMGLKAEAKAEFALAEGKASISLYAPHRIGWVLKLTSRDGKKIYPLGSIRAQLELVLVGVVGASMVAELACEVEVTSKKVGVRGVSTPGAPPPPLDPSLGPDISVRAVKATPLKAEVGVFAGAKADLDLNGSVQWLNPENKDKKFEDFIKVAPGLSGLAGAGASAKFEVSYTNGKFVIVMAASVCLGLGARGKIACETNAVLIYKFITWFFYQLYHANYEFLVFVQKEAFRALQHIQFLAIQSGKDVKQFLHETADQIDAAVVKVLGIMDKTDSRNTLATRVLSDSSMLRHSTPETKGMLLYQLTRHGKADWVDNDNYERGDAFHDRKRAVLTILRWVQTDKELKNVLHRVTARGTKSEGSWRGLIVKFLKLGYDDMDDELLRLEKRLKTQPSRGHAVAYNDSHQYEMYTSDSPRFAMASAESLSSIHFGHVA
jgi:hypothetical protein